MATPHRGNTGPTCYFIIGSTFQKQRQLLSDKGQREKREGTTSVVPLRRSGACCARA